MHAVFTSSPPFATSFTIRDNVQDITFLATMNAVLPVKTPPVGTGQLHFCYHSAGSKACFKIKDECIKTCQVAIRNRAEHVAAAEASSQVTANLFAAHGH